MISDNDVVKEKRIMSKQPEALRLADWIEGDMSCQGDAEIVAELRRLHAANQELLEALKQCAVLIHGGNRQGDAAITAARAVIAKAEGA